MITCIAALDYVINEKYRYDQLHEKTPQCSFILNYLIGNTSIHAMIKKNPMDIKDKYLRVCEYIKLIVQKKDDVVPSQSAMQNGLQHPSQSAMQNGCTIM